MLRKKETVQKTFRIDENVNDDFETLSEILERTQNDLANIAIEKLIIDNRYWLAQNILVDYASDFFFRNNDAKYEVEGIEVEIKWKDEENVILTIVQKSDNGDIIQKVEERYNVLEDINYNQKIQKTLRYFGSIIDYNSMTVSKYLEGKLNYK